MPGRECHYCKGFCRILTASLGFFLFFNLLTLSLDSFSYIYKLFLEIFKEGNQTLPFLFHYFYQFCFFIYIMLFFVWKIKCSVLKNSRNPLFSTFIHLNLANCSIWTARILSVVSPVWWKSPPLFGSPLHLNKHPLWSLVRPRTIRWMTIEADKKRKYEYILA